jgi:hypothetical protein
MAKKTKNPSLKQVAKAYKKSTKPATNTNEGARYFTDDAKSTHLGAKTRKNAYKPASKQVTLGGTSKSGKGVTKYKKGTV